MRSPATGPCVEKPPRGIEPLRPGSKPGALPLSYGGGTGAGGVVAGPGFGARPGLPAHAFGASSCRARSSYGSNSSSSAARKTCSAATSVSSLCSEFADGPRRVHVEPEPDRSRRRRSRASWSARSCAGKRAVVLAVRIPEELTVASCPRRTPTRGQPRKPGRLSNVRSFTRAR